jgi:IS5 family transposase
VTPGNAYDGRLLRPLLEDDLAKDIPLETVAADRGYDDGDNHALLKSKGLHSAIHLNAYRTHKKDPNKQGWLELQASREYQAGLSERYKIEAKFGEGKRGHGLRRCRYLGLLRYGVQAILTAIVLNLKRMVKLLTGTNFKGRARLTA